MSLIIIDDTVAGHVEIKFWPKVNKVHALDDREQAITDGCDYPIKVIGSHDG